MFEVQRRQSEIVRKRNDESAKPIMSSVVGASIIAVAILRSTLILSPGTRYIGFEGPSDETAWLVDRLTGAVYRCHALEQGRAACEEPITGSIKK